MSTIKKRRTREEWRAIIAEAEQHPVSLRAYCQERGIPVGSVYAIRSKLNGAPKQVSAFARVEVVAAKTKLPDPHWVARFVRYLLEVQG